MFLKLVNISLFLVYIYGLGYSLTRFITIRSPETWILRLGIGLGAFPVMLVALDFLGIPLHWVIILLVSCLFPLLDLIYFKRRPPKIQWHSSPWILGGLMAIFAAMLYCYCGGAFQYPWLEDDDSWGHAAGIKYIALEQNIHVPSGMFYYLNPYPPGYDGLFGVLHQTHPSLYWTLKFFNGFMISLGFLFFYLLAKELSRSDIKALLSTFFLSVIPCYLSHFIWAQALIVTLFFPAFYCLLQVRKNNKHFILPAALVTSGIFLTQPTTAMKFCILVLLLWLAAGMVDRKFHKSMLLVMLLSGVFSLMWWGPVIKDMRKGESNLLVRNDTEVSGQHLDAWKMAKRVFNPAKGTATRKYTVQDYFIASEHNLINNPVGVGPTLCLLAIVGMMIHIHFLRKGDQDDQFYALTVVSWTLFTFLGMNSMTFDLPVGLFAFRFWTLFAIPTVLLAAEALYQIVDRLERPLSRKLVPVLLITSIVFTSGYAKFSINTALWPFGVYWTSFEELKGYMALRERFAPNTKVFAFSDNLLVIGLDMRADYWRADYRETFAEAIRLDPQELNARLKRFGFEYVIFSEREVKQWGLEFVNQRLKSLQESPHFSFVTGTKTAWIFHVNS
jgi:hypothetical protein